MSKSLKILKYLLLVSAGLIVLFYGGLFVLFMLIGINDQASYYGDTVDVGSIDYNSHCHKSRESRI